MTESETVEFHQLSTEERDRRWARIREKMSEQGIDALLAYGNSGRWNEMHSTVRYLSGYADMLSGAGYVIFPIAGDGTLITQMHTKRSAWATSWLADIRSDAAIPIVDVLSERLSELGLSSGTLGLAGIAFYGEKAIGMPWNVVRDIESALPKLNIVDATEMLFDLRSVKSDEEIACLERSAALVDVGYRALIDLARPGVSERLVHLGVTHAMEAAGAEAPSFHLLESGPMPGKMQAGDPSPSNRTLRTGDVICNETSPKWLGYQAQGLQCVVLGEPIRQMQELAKYATEIFNTCADLIRPGNTPERIARAGDKIIEDARSHLGPLADGLWPDCDAAGLGAPDPAPRPAALQANQAFMLEIGAGGRPYNPPVHLYGGHCIVTTESAPRHLTEVPIEDRLLITID